MITRRERVRQAAIDEIKSIAWDIINKQGTADVTIHAIAKKMGMTPPAFYSYFKSRDALMNALVLDAYDSFQNALETARDSLSGKSIAKQLMAIYLAYRQWAVNHPALFGLFAGGKVPGFNPPEKEIVQKADIIAQIFFELFKQASKEGLLKPPENMSPLPKAYRANISKTKQKLGFNCSEEIANALVHITFFVHGSISMEISGRYHHMLDDFSQLYTYQISNELKRIGIDPG